MRDLKDIRLDLDEIDGKIADLLAKRMDLSLEVAKSKKASGKAILDEAREAQKLESVASLVDDSKKDGVKEVFKTIMAESRKIQEKEHEKQ